MNSIEKLLYLNGIDTLMRILLVGEYSRLHNSLKEGLQSLGHTVLLVGTGDDFKNFPVDINIQSRYFESGLLRFVKRVSYKLFRIDVCGLERGIRFLKAIRKEAPFDVVQLINERSIEAGTSFEMFLIKRLRKKHKKLFLLCCGTDYITVQFAYQKKLKYSFFTPYFEGLTKGQMAYTYLLNYLKSPQKRLHDFLYKKINGVIASDMDYHLALKEHKSYLGLIPNPVNTDKIAFQPLEIKGKIHIFHGINSSNFYKKGNYIFEKALQVIKQKHGDKVDINTTRDLPYQEYVKANAACHILLDQVFSYDQGYNALENMARGKVVVTGAETEFLEHYGLQKNHICINALPDVSSIVEELDALISDPKRIVTMGSNARKFIEETHHYQEIATAYVNCWNAN